MNKPTRLLLVATISLTAASGFAAEPADTAQVSAPFANPTYAAPNGGANITRPYFSNELGPAGVGKSERAGVTNKVVRPIPWTPQDDQSDYRRARTEDVID